MTDLEYDMLCILVEVKVLTQKELQELYVALEIENMPDWGWLIQWLNSKPNVEPKTRKKMTAADYAKNQILG
jgi:hypothetical protein